MSDIETLQMALIGYEAERQKIEATMAEIRGQLGTHSKGASAPAKTPTSEAKPKHRMSAAGRARIAEAQTEEMGCSEKAFRTCGPGKDTNVRSETQTQDERGWSCSDCRGANGRDGLQRKSIPNLRPQKKL